MLFVNNNTYNNLFSPGPATLAPDLRAEELKKGWMEVRLPFYLLTSMLFYKVCKLSTLALGLTLALRARGLSNGGSEFLAMLWVTMSKSSFYRQRSLVLQRTLQSQRSYYFNLTSLSSLCYSIRFVCSSVVICLVNIVCLRIIQEEQPFSCWVDNFSHSYKFGVPSVTRGVWTACLWTVWGTISVNRPLEVIKLDSLKPAMPTDLLSAEGLDVLFKQYLDILRSSWHRFDISVSRKARRIPLGDLPSTKATKFSPFRLTGENPASNIGLGHIILRYIDENKWTKTYKILLVDINLYQRLLKVPSLSTSVACLICC